MHDTNAAFWEIAGPLIATGKADRGTVMRMECLRVNGNFAAGISSNGELILKLDGDRVGEMVKAGTGRPFAPAGRTFKEWVSVPAFDRDGWERLIHESCAFAGR